MGEGLRSVEAPLWRPSPESVERAQLSVFARGVEVGRATPLSAHAAFYRGSLEEPARFWSV